MADKRAFTIEINGLEKSYTDTTKLLTVLKKLPSLLGNINKQTSTLTQTLGNVNRQTQSQEKALTAQEKAEKKLQETREQRLALDTQIGREQASETQQLQQRQQELNRTIQLENTQNESLDQKKLRIEALTAQYRALSEKERENNDIGGKLLTQLQTLRTEYTNLEARLSDDAAGKFANSLEGLSKVIDTSVDKAKNMVSLFQTGVTTFAMFGDESESTKELLNNLSKVTAVLNLVQLANKEILAKSIIIEKAKAATDFLVTKGIISQTVAQRALNIATVAFPLLAITALLGTFIALTSSATDKTKSFTSAMDGVSFASKEARDKHDDFVRSIRDLQIQIDVTTGKLTQYEADILQIQNSFKDKTDEIKKNLKDSKDSINDEISSLEKINEVADKISQVAPIFYPTRFAANYLIADKIEKDKEKINQLEKDSAKQTVDAEILKDNAILDKTTKHNINILKLNEDYRIANLNGIEKTEAQIERRRDEALNKAKKDNKAAQKQRLKGILVEYTDEKSINDAFDKELREARASSAKTAGDEAKARRIKELEERKAILQKQLELVRKAEDDETSFIKDEYDKRAKQIEIRYEREREDLNKQLVDYNQLIENSKGEEKAIYEKSAEAIRKQIDNINQHIFKEQQVVWKEQNAKLLDEHKSYLDMMTEEYQQAYSKIGNMTKRINKKDGSIDLKASQENYIKINGLLSEYGENLKSSKKDITEYYDDLIDSYDKDSIEYAKATHDKKIALHQIDDEIRKVNKEIGDNNKESLDLQEQHWEEYSKKVNEKITKISEISNSIFEGMNSFMQASIDSAKEKLEELTTAYDKAVSDREESDSRLEALSERAKSAEGNRSAALISQLNQEMEKNKALADQEKSLAKQKEKLEADIAKKEKKQKKMAAGQQVLQAGINTALGITSALGQFPPNIPLSIIVGAMGAAQTAVAAANYAKMEKGGYIEG